jgi:glycosyltransferase involved in cell wall biosynthesis
MKILWICNIPTPEISRKLELTIYNTGGWLQGLSLGLSKIEGIDLHYLFPSHEVSGLVREKVGNITYHAISRKSKSIKKIDKSLISMIEDFSKTESYDIIHMFGTELPFNFLASNTFDKSKFVTSIQGLVSVYEQHYMANLPVKCQLSYTLYELFKRSTLLNQKADFYRNGLSEVSIIKNTNNIIGRTDWDLACSKHINNDIKYYFCNETLRPKFYDSKWDIEKIERNTIFISQATYPIKGFHIALEAVNIVKKTFPDIKILVAGPDIFYKKGLLNWIKRSTYAKYVRKLILKFDLRRNIYFLGNLNEDQMASTYLRSHVFLSPSSIENSSNSLGEAMLVGTPSISSYVGGISSIFTHNIDGFLYPFDEPYMLAHYLTKILNDDRLANEFSKQARDRALNTHSSEINSQRLVDIYKNILTRK